MNKFLISLAFLGLIVGSIFFWLASVDLTPDANGIIHHPTYGDYPAVVPFKQGMTLHPGQSSSFTATVPHVPEEATSTTTTLEGGENMLLFPPHPFREQLGSWKPGHRFRLTKDGWVLEEGSCGVPDAPLNCMD